MSEVSCKTLIIIGCGRRGEVYRFPNKVKVIGFSDPRLYARKKFLNIYETTVVTSLVFSDWYEFIKLGKRVADCAVITLPDKLHKDAAVEFTRLGYDMLLEKPMATSLEDCWQITLACRQMPQQINAVCHGLRYHVPCVKIKEIIDSGILGDIININHTDHVGFFHFAHSFVRGNWHKEKDSTFALLSKCCHDIDIIVYWMGLKKKCAKVSSLGSLFHFKKENAPPNSADICFNCEFEPNCCYSAKKIYLNPSQKTTNWPSSIVLGAEIYNIEDESTSRDIEDILRDKNAEPQRRSLLEKCLAHPKTNYGRCVYSMDNDVCDNQVVSMFFDDGSTATVTMIGECKDKSLRKTTVYGTRGQLTWDEANEENIIEHFDFLTREKNLIKYSNTCETDEDNQQIIFTDADFHLIENFIEALMKNDKSFVKTDVEESFRSHSIVFAAEHSRVNNCVVDMAEFYKINNISI